MGSEMCIRDSGDAAYLAIAKSRSASGTACQAGDEIGRITFVPHDGTDLNHHAAEIKGYVDTGIGSNDTPGYLTFHTNAGTTTTTERLRITSGGNVKIASGVIENSNTISSNYTVSSNYNAMSAGPMSISSGVSVTVPSGSAWTIV